MIETMIEFRLKATNGSEMPGEVMLLRISQIMALFPRHKHIRTVDGNTMSVCDQDWDKVEKAFRSAYLGNRVRTVEARGFEKPLKLRDEVDHAHYDVEEFDEQGEYEEKA